MPTNILTIRFENELKPYEVSLFRGAVINSLDEKLMLFHDHEGDKLRYSYPLIQYKRIGGRAAIVCLQQGSADIGEFFSSNNFTMHIGERIMDAKISSVIPLRYNVQVWDKSFKYSINRWIPFNSDNFQKYQQIEGIAEKITFLEKILIGNILSFAKGLDIWFEGQVDCTITKLSEPFFVTAKGVKMACFNAEFQTNVSIPNFVGLGKHVSIGFGTVTHNYSTKIKQQEQMA